MRPPPHRWNMNYGMFSLPSHPDILRHVSRHPTHQIDEVGFTDPILLLTTATVIASFRLSVKMSFLPFRCYLQFRQRGIIKRKDHLQRVRKPGIQKVEKRPGF